MPSGSFGATPIGGNSTEFAVATPWLGSSLLTAGAAAAGIGGVAAGEGISDVTCMP